MQTSNSATILDNLEQLRLDLRTGVYFEWHEPAPRGRKGPDHSARRLITIRVGGEPRNPANPPPSVSLERRTMSINLEALRRFVSESRYPVVWMEEPDGGARSVSLLIRSPAAYDTIGWNLLRDEMERSRTPES